MFNERFVKEQRTQFYLEDQARTLFILARNVWDLKKELICSICLDVYEIPTAVFNCDHVFCEKCIKTYLEYSTVSDPPCPVCEKPIARDSLQIKNNPDLTKAIEYVIDGEKELRKMLDADVTEKPSFTEIWNLVQKNKDKVKLPPQSQVAKFDYTELLKAKKILIRANGEVLTVDGKVPTGRPAMFTTKGTTKTPQSRKQKPQATIVTETQIKTIPSAVKQDLFDIVKKSGEAKPLCQSTRTYQRPRCKKKQTENDDVHEFQDNSVKQDIIRWLNDTRNKFEQISTPEDTIHESEILTPDFDLPSVSQKHKHRSVAIPPITQINKQKLVQNSIRQKARVVTELTHHRIPNPTKKNHRRTRSLGCTVKMITKKSNINRHSITICESPDPEIVIEQINSEDVIMNEIIKNPNEKTAIVDLMENQYINKIDNELGQKICGTKKEQSPNSPKLRKSMPSLLHQAVEESNKRLARLKTTSAWNSVKEIKKTIGKTERKPRKLKVSEISHTSLTGTSSNVTNKENVRGSGNKIKCRDTVFDNKPLAFDLNTIESYFNKNRAILEATTSIFEKKVTKKVIPVNTQSYNTRYAKNKNSIPSTFGSSNKQKLNKTDVKQTQSIDTGKKLPNTQTKQTTASNSYSSKSNNKKAIENPVENANNKNGITQPSEIDDENKIDRNKTDFEQNNIKTKSVLVNLVRLQHLNITSVNSFERDKSPDDEIPILHTTEGLVSKKQSTQLYYDLNDNEGQNSSKQNRKSIITPINNEDNLTLQTAFDAGKMPLLKIIPVEIKSLEAEINVEKRNGNEKQVVNLTTLPSNKDKSIFKPPPIMHKIVETNVYSDDKVCLMQTQGSQPTSENAIERNKPVDGDILFLSTPESEVSKNQTSQLDSDVMDKDKEQHNTHNNKNSNLILHSDIYPLKVIRAKMKIHKTETNVGINTSKEKQVINLTTFPSNKDISILKPITGHKIAETNMYSDDEIFMIPTQVNQFLTSQQKGKVNKTYDNDIFVKETEVFPSLNTYVNDGSQSVVTNLKEKISSLGEILNDFRTNTLFNYNNKSDVVHVDLMTQSLNAPDFLIKMQKVLDDMELLIKHMPNKEMLHETKDVDVQTNDSKDIFSLSISTQTLNAIKHVGIQTEYDSPGGFRISSSAVFNIQSGVAAEVQTDPVVCEKCNHEAVPSIQITSDVLSADAKFLKTLTNKYTLSASFDNIDFDTQEVIKGKQINSTTDSNKKEGLNIPANSNLKEAEKLDSHMECNANIVSQAFERKTDQKKSFKRIRKPSSDSESESMGSTDVLPKNIKKNKYIEEDISIHFESGFPKETSNSPTGKGYGSTLSEESDDLNYKEMLDRIMKKYDAEPDTSTGSKVIPSPKPTHMLDDVMSNLQINNDEPPVKKSKTQDIIKECEMIIKNACSETIQLEDTQPCTINVNQPSKLTLAVLEEEFQANFTNNSIENIHEVDILQPNSRNNKHKFSESLFTDDNYINQSLTKSKTNDDKLNVSKQSLNDIIEQFNKSYDSFDDNIDAEVAAINIENNNLNATHKVRVLQDITIAHANSMNALIPKDPGSIGIGMVKKMENENVTPNKFDRSNNGEIIDLSDSEVVEGTPQKEKVTSVDEIVQLSQMDYYNPGHLPLTMNEFLDPPVEDYAQKHFTPPPEFQDVLDNVDAFQENDDKSNPIIRKSSLTPDLMLSQNEGNTPLNRKTLITSTPLTQASQIISAYSLNLSPIKLVKESKSVNPLQAAQNSKKLPLTLIQIKTPPPKGFPLSTSTPKQESILNYVQFHKNVISQRSPNTTIPETNRKPCVACTRMNKEQLVAITSLSNKKMVTYSNIFSPTVTHMIVVVNDNQCIKDHTMKFVLAVASGIWVLGFNWVEECLKQGRIIPEEPFEALDVSGRSGPRQARLNRVTEPLFKGFKIHAAPPFLSTTQKEVEEVITLLGGEVVARPDELLSKNGKICLIITEAKGSQDFELYETWLESLRVVTVDLEWLSRSVGQYQCQSVHSFSLCSDSSICNLGYPSELIVEVPFSFSQTSSS